MISDQSNRNNYKQNILSVIMSNATTYCDSHTNCCSATHQSNMHDLFAIIYPWDIFSLKYLQIRSAGSDPAAFYSERNILKYKRHLSVSPTVQYVYICENFFANQCPFNAKKKQYRNIDAILSILFKYVFILIFQCVISMSPSIYLFSVKWISCRYLNEYSCRSGRRWSVGYCVLRRSEGTDLSWIGL